MVLPNTTCSAAAITAASGPRAAAGWALEPGGASLRREEPSHEPMDPTLRALLGAGVEVAELSVQPPRLEDVFLELVGGAGRKG